MPYRHIDGCAISKAVLFAALQCMGSPGGVYSPANAQRCNVYEHLSMFILDVVWKQRHRSTSSLAHSGPSRPASSLVLIPPVMRHYPYPTSHLHPPLHTNPLDFDILAPTKQRMSHDMYVGDRLCIPSKLLCLVPELLEASNCQPTTQTQGKIKCKQGKRSLSC